MSERGGGDRYMIIKLFRECRPNELIMKRVNLLHEIARSRFLGRFLLDINLNNLIKKLI